MVNEKKITYLAEKSKTKRSTVSSQTFVNLEQVSLKPQLQTHHCLTTWLQIWYHGEYPKCRRLRTAELLIRRPPRGNGVINFSLFHSKKAGSQTESQISRKNYQCHYNRLSSAFLNTDNSRRCGEEACASSFSTCHNNNLQRSRHRFFAVAKFSFSLFEIIFAWCMLCCCCYPDVVR